MLWKELIDAMVRLIDKKMDLSYAFLRMALLAFVGFAVTEVRVAAQDAPTAQDASTDPIPVIDTTELLRPSVTASASSDTLLDELADDIAAGDEVAIQAVPLNAAVPTSDPVLITGTPALWSGLLLLSLLPFLPRARRTFP